MKNMRTITVEIEANSSDCGRCQFLECVDTLYCANEDFRCLAFDSPLKDKNGSPLRCKACKQSEKQEAK